MLQQRVDDQPTISREMAREAQLDLVEVAANERPPVCKIMDYGKFKFLQKQKQKDKTKSHQQKLKEIRVRPKTGEHDVDTKILALTTYLGHVNVTSTYWYLSAVPELMAITGRRFAAYAGRDGGG